MRNLKMSEWTTEDDKLVTLARGARARVGAESGAALRDTTGRTYSGTNVNRGPLTFTAIELIVAQAISSGSTGIEAVVVVADDVLVTSKDVDVVEAAGGVGIPVHIVDNTGTLLRTLYS
jgi:cytidine deaminase